MNVITVQVERMIAKQEVKHQPRPAAITAASSSKPSRNNTTSGPKAIDIGSNASQAAQTTTDAGTDASKGGTQKMTRDRIISKFSKKKPAYSSCRMLSQVSNVVARSTHLREFQDLIVAAAGSCGASD